MTPFIEALHALAASLAALPSTRAAIERWHLEIQDARLARAAEQTARRLRLGASARTAFDPLLEVEGRDAQLLVDVLVAHSGSGVALSRSVSGIADVISSRRHLEHQSRAAAIASTLSTRMIALMGVLFALLLPAWRNVPPSTALVTGIFGLILGWAGVVWARRLTPTIATADDLHAALADLIATLVEGGMPLHQALQIATEGLEPLRKVRGLVELGAAWPHALERSGDPVLKRLGTIIKAALEMGLPVTARLNEFARALRAERARRFELRVRRAPVLLVLPLTLCVLPAFTLIIGVPLLHSVSS